MILDRRLHSAALSLALAAGGCATVSPPASVESRSGGIEIALRSAEMQMIVFQTPDDVERFCMAPAPDAVPVTSRQLTLGAGAESLGGTLGRGADALGGRGDAVLLARELLYRACELSLNYRLEKAEALELYHATLALIGRVAPALGPPASSDDDDDIQPASTNDDE